MIVVTWYLNWYVKFRKKKKIKNKMVILYFRSKNGK